jgi:hypothetical protein
MILPSKHLPPDRALIGIGAEILSQLIEPRSFSELWEAVRETHSRAPSSTPLSFDWFVLALNLLYAMSAVDHRNGILRLETPQ